MAKNILSTLNKIDKEIKRIEHLNFEAKQQHIAEIIRLLKCAIRKYGKPISFEAVGEDGTITTHMMTRAIPCYMENDDEYADEGEYCPFSTAEWAWYYLKGNKLFRKYCDAEDIVFEYREEDEDLIRRHILLYGSRDEQYTIRHLFAATDDDPIWCKAQAYYTDEVMKAIEVTAECAKQGILFGKDKDQWIISYCHVYKCIGGGIAEYVDNTGIHKDWLRNCSASRHLYERAKAMPSIEQALAAFAERDAEQQRLLEKQRQEEQEELRQRNERKAYILQCFRMAHTSCPFGSYYSVSLFGKRGQYGESGDRTPMWNLDGKMERIKQFFEKYDTLFAERKIKRIDCSDFKMRDDVDDLDISIRLETECYGVRKPYGDITLIDTDGNTYQEYIL